MDIMPCIISSGISLCEPLSKLICLGEDVLDRVIALLELDVLSKMSTGEVGAILYACIHAENCGCKLRERERERERYKISCSMGTHAGPLHVCLLC
jgi:hypothetical protein